VAEFAGRPLSSFRRELLALAEEIGRKEKKAGAVYNRSTAPDLARLRYVNRAYRQILLSPDLEPDLKFFGAARLLEFHEMPGHSVDILEAGPEFAEDAYAFILRSRKDLRGDLDGAPAPALDLKVIFHYLLSGYARVDEEATSRLPLLDRFRRAGNIVRFILGRGSLRKLGSRHPETGGLEPLAVLAGLRMEKAGADRYFHYLASKLYSLHFCGNAALKLTYVQGLRHLLLTYPVVFTLAGLNAATAKRELVTAADVSAALMIVDHTFARSPFFKLRHVQMMIKKLSSGKAFPLLLRLFHSEKPLT
jgi:hypothetical protein